MRYPNIDRLEDRRPRGFNEADHRRLLRRCEEIRRRTYCHAWLDSMRNHICIGYDHEGSPRLVWTNPAYRHGRPFCFDPLCDGWSVDDICQMVFLARVNPALKDKWHRQKLEAEASERTRRDEQYAQEQAENIVSDAAWGRGTRIHVNRAVHN